MELHHSAGGKPEKGHLGVQLRRGGEQSLEALTIQDSRILVPGGGPSFGEEGLGSRGEGIA